MSIQIEVPLDALKRPSVAQALSDLMLLLGGQSAAPRQSTTAATPPATRRRRAPAKKAAAPEPVIDTSVDAKTRWRQFVATRPERTRRFLTLLEQHGQLSVDQAVEYLNLPGPKAMGGLTGALRRWAPRKGVDLPFKAIQNAQGQRCWVWEGVKG
jgi:hypothetical protein